MILQATACHSIRLENIMSHTFETMTDQVKYMFENASTHETLEVSSHAEGLNMVKDALWKGEMSRTYCLIGYYRKYVYAMSQDGTWLYRYALVWKEYIPS